ncbi:hypothetical protein [Haloglomus litoreum]|uniref:hypothetical protein n=1 Tax=Haloglomus litoreum TaxID=3034026 RepID=UPI0023E81EBC|nr:hypothetical protein [Haloglomus sp. DT116]
MRPRSRIALELAVIIAGYALVFAVVELPAVRMAVPQSVATVVWAVLGATVLLFITEVGYYVGTGSTGCLTRCEREYQPF